MPRATRIVIPGLAHHVIQRGNRKQRIFFNPGDCRNYVRMLAAECGSQDVRCLAWCLMPNHVHLILRPIAVDGLRAVLSSVHTRFAQSINGREGVSGHLFQGRYRSYPMDDAHLMIAVRYVENNPVKAGLVKSAGDWRWSSAQSHLGLDQDPLTDRAGLGAYVSNWMAYLTDGIEQADRDDEVERAFRRGAVVTGPA